jgi:N-acetylglucosaminyldiphosphoundecaprenol N-acetyl-beta-D-mannosaminyltransferase
MVDRIKILDIWVDAIDKKSAIKKVQHYLTHGTRPHSIFAANPEKNYSFPKDYLLYTTFRNADLLLPDGSGIVWAARLLFGLRLERIPGSEFIGDICKLATKEGYGIFLYGAKEKVNAMAAQNMKKAFPGLKIVGRSNGYVKHSEMKHLIDRINESRADILFIALGSPKQERWFATFRRHLKHVKVCQCIGGTLDTIAGTVKRAPENWQKLSLEWLYRLIAQPSRIKRQKVLPLFVISVLVSKIKHFPR